MLTILWAVVIVGTLVLTTVVAGRDAFDAGRNRLNASRAVWFANDCAERARLAIDNALNNPDPIPERAWRSLDVIVRDDPTAAGSNCDTRLEGTGTRLDVNSASEDDLTRLFNAAGLVGVEGLVDALADWRDDDPDPRPSGAEAAWYAAQGRGLPRNGPLVDDAELLRIRGFEDGVASRFLTVEPGPISIATAPAAVLRSMPGFTDEAANAVIALRQRGQQIEDLLGFAASLSSAANDSLVSQYQVISRRSTLNPEAWVLTASGSSGVPAIRARVELRLVRTNRRAVIVRRRVWK